MIEKLSARVIAMIVGVLLIVGLAVFGLSQCHSAKTAKKQAEVSQGQAGAAIDSGAVAINTLSNVATNGAATDAALAQGQGEVRAAPEADKGRAAVNAACRFKANKDKPECKEPVR